MVRLAASGWCNQSGCAHTESMRAAAKLVAEPLWMQSRNIYVEYNTSHELIFLCRILRTVTNGSQPPMQVRHSDRIHCRQREGFGRVSSSCSRNWKGLLVLYNYISGILACRLRSPPTKPGRSSIHTLHSFTCNMAPLRSYTARDLEGKRTCTGWIAATSTANAATQKLRYYKCALSAITAAHYTCLALQTNKQTLYDNGLLGYLLLGSWTLKSV